jgi:hypothetical protein
MTSLLSTASIAHYRTMLALAMDSLTFIPCRRVLFQLTRLNPGSMPHIRP